MTRPGDRLRALARRACSPSTMERLIDPAVADLQCEHADAIRRGQLWRSRRVLVAGYVAIWKVTLLAASVSATREQATMDNRAVVRTTVFAAIAVIVLTALLVVPPLSQFSARVDAKTLIEIIWYLLPQALSVALPMGIVFGILLGLRGRIATPRVRGIVAALAIVCAVASLVNVGWILPAGNQKFRELAFQMVSGESRVYLSRGMNELTLVELASLSTFEFNFRLAFALSPLVLGFLSLTAAALASERRRVITAGIWALAICFAFYVLLYFARQNSAYKLGPAMMAWGPDLAFAATALLLYLRRPTRSAASVGEQIVNGH